MKSASLAFGTIVLGLVAACARLVPAEPLLDRGAPSAARPLAPEAFDRHLARARAFLEPIATYRCRLEARERLGDVLIGKALDLRLGQRPFRMAFELLAPPSDAGQKVYWDETWNDGELWVRPPGLAGALLGHLSLDPLGKLALKGQRHPVTDIGLGRLIEQVEARWLEARGQGGEVWSVATTLGQRPATLVGFRVVQDDRTEARLRVGFDDAWGVAVYSAFEGTEGGEEALLEEYLYRDLQWNPELEEGAFRP